MKLWFRPPYPRDILLRILATLEAKRAQISNFWTFWSVIQLIHLLLTSSCIDQKGVIQIFETWSINRITVQNVQKLLILAVLASCVASILKENDIALVYEKGEPDLQEWNPKCFPCLSEWSTMSMTLNGKCSLLNIPRRIQMAPAWIQDCAAKMCLLRPLSLSYQELWSSPPPESVKRGLVGPTHRSIFLYYNNKEPKRHVFAACNTIV